MLRVTQGVIETWGRYERARAWGLRQEPLEPLALPAGLKMDHKMDHNNG